MHGCDHQPVKKRCEAAHFTGSMKHRGERHPIAIRMRAKTENAKPVSSKLRRRIIDEAR
ncbi:unnamed protein product [Albugo candida]|uniref:Uncharacterized protein n=1 Tax=Albugo candida TaxID=65357 RepID=A0A024FVY7_9STRA|nr:unnamed protein product [Albugo candida]|eukprot:CCI11047.1 unnamed protein product [Albugo candida]